MEKNPLPHGEAFIITQGERERKGAKRGTQRIRNKGKKTLREKDGNP